MEQAVMSVAVLVVEDSPLVRSDAVQRFQDLGVTVFDAYSAERALSILARHPEIQLVFSDIRLPGRDGITLANRILRDYPGVQVALTSAYVGDSPINGVP